MMDSVEPGLHWTDHFAKYGFAVVRNLVDREFCEEALQEVERIVGNGVPVQEWTTENTPVLHRPFYEGATPPQPVLDRLFDQPRLLAAIDELYGGPGRWNHERNYYLFLKPYNPKGQARLSPRGHIDFGSQIVPSLYRGFTFQLALMDTEPFSGNITLHPGTHKVVQKALMDNPELQFPGGGSDLPMPEPFEFVARAGDVVFMHHLMFHSGNESHSANRVSRIGLHGEAFRDEWLTEIDPSRPDLSPWERSLALNGAFVEYPKAKEFQTRKRAEYLEKLKTQDGATDDRY